MSYSLDDFDELDRVQISPACDAWMQGDRFGEVQRVGRRLVHVRLDRSGRVLRLAPRFIYENYRRTIPW